MKDVIVKFFNAHGAFGNLQSERYSPECEEEWYIFEENDTGSLTVYRYTYVEGIPSPEVIDLFAAGRWAEATYQ